MSSGFRTRIIPVKPTRQERIDKISARVKFLLDTPDAPLPPNRKTWSLQQQQESG